MQLGKFNAIDVDMLNLKLTILNVRLQTSLNSQHMTWGDGETNTEDQKV